MHEKYHDSPWGRTAGSGPTGKDERGGGGHPQQLPPSHPTHRGSNLEHHHHHHHQQASSSSQSRFMSSRRSGDLCGGSVSEFASPSSSSPFLFGGVGVGGLGGKIRTPSPSSTVFGSNNSRQQEQQEQHQLQHQWGIDGGEGAASSSNVWEARSQDGLLRGGDGRGRGGGFSTRPGSSLGGSGARGAQYTATEVVSHHASIPGHPTSESGSMLRSRSDIVGEKTYATDPSFSPLPGSVVGKSGDNTRISSAGRSRGILGGYSPPPAVGESNGWAFSSSASSSSFSSSSSGLDQDRRDFNDSSRSRSSSGDRSDAGVGGGGSRGRDGSTTTRSSWSRANTAPRQHSGMDPDLHIQSPRPSKPQSWHSPAPSTPPASSQLRAPSYSSATRSSSVRPSWGWSAALASNSGSSSSSSSNGSSSRSSRSRSDGRRRRYDAEYSSDSASENEEGSTMRALRRDGGSRTSTNGRVEKEEEEAGEWGLVTSGGGGRWAGVAGGKSRLSGNASAGDDYHAVGWGGGGGNVGTGRVGGFDTGNIASGSFGSPYSATPNDSMGAAWGRDTTGNHLRRRMGRVA